MIKKLLLLALLLTGVATVSANLVFTYNYNRTTHTCVVTGHYGTPDRSKVYVPLGIGYPGETSNYKVVGIEAKALNDLVGVDTIVIPNTVTYIGHISESTLTSSKFADLRNFQNCPDLAYIQVAEGNTVFKSTGAGILTSADGKQVYRVPPRINVTKTKGELKMAASGVIIAEHAFDGNTTVKKLVFSKNLEYLHPECGIHKMTALESLSYAAGGTAGDLYMCDNDAIIRKSDKKLMFYPPACPEETYIVTPINVSVIGEHAFANTTRLKEVIVPEGPRTTGNYAFENSSVEKVTFPSTLDFVTGSGYGAFKNSKIKELTWNAKEKRSVPRDFMLDCSDLTAVHMDIPFGSVGSSAFRNCVKLKNLPPFDYETGWGGDSIWANTGLEDVTFIESLRENSFQREAKALFADCKHLKWLDMTGIQICTDRYRLTLPESLAAGCDSLRTVKLPGFISIDPSCFRGCGMISKIVIHQAEIEEGPVFCYNSSETECPHVFIKTPPNCGGCIDSPIDKLFANLGSGDVLPTFYFEEMECGLRNFVVPSINYIPAGCFRSFPKATPQTPVYSMYEFSMEDTGSNMELVFTTTPAVKMLKADVNLFPNYQKKDVVNNRAVFDREYLDATLIFLDYRVDGEYFQAGYSKHQFPWNLKDEEVETRVDEVESGEGMRLEGNMLFMPEGSQSEIYNTSGMKVISSSESQIDVASLGTGIYIVVCRTEDSTTTKRIRL